MSEWEAAGKSDDWFTPKYIFDALGLVFDLDVAAPEEGPRYVPCRSWLHENSLDQVWWGLVWMNPPFGPRNGLTPWLAKFLRHGTGVALTPDRTSAPWFQQAARQMDCILFVSPKVKFERPDGSIGRSPGSGVALMAKGEIARDALRAASPRLGLLMEPI